MSKKNPITPASFANVLVTAMPRIDPGSGKVVYDTTFSPEVLEVRQADTIVNYQLVSPTPEGVCFDYAEVGPIGSDQLSTATIGLSGKVLTFSNANTKKVTLNISLYFRDADGMKFMVDPEIENEPRH